MRFLLGISPASEHSDAGEIPKGNVLHIEHGESLKSRINYSY